MKTMTHPSCARLALLAVAAIFAFGPLAASAEAREEEQLRVYQVGDLPAWPALSTDDEATTALARNIATSIGVPAIHLAPGLLMVELDAEGQDRFAAALDAIRASFGDPLGVRISIRLIGDREGVRVGSRFDADAGRPLLQHQQIIHPGHPARVAASRTVFYVGDISPVVSASAVAHDPTVDSAEEGLILNVLADPGRDGRTSLRITGEFTHIEVAGEMMEVNAAVQAPMTLELPRIDRRTIGAEVSLRMGDEVVFAVVQAPGDADQLLAITATIWPLTD